MRIAIDAMGGDNAPECNVEGALAAAAEWKDTEIVLVGDESKIQALLQKSGGQLPSNLGVRHAGEVIGPEDELGQGGSAQKGCFHGRGRTHAKGKRSRRDDFGLQHAKRSDDDGASDRRKDGRHRAV